MKTLICGGHLIDPANQKNGQFNLLLENGKVIWVGTDLPEADRIIDAAGKIVTPGFIDIHMHEDPVEQNQIQQCIFPMMLRQGVTTAVGGNCGGIYGGPPSQFSNFDSFWADATQKRGAVEMPYCSILGTADKVVPFYTPDRYNGNSFLTAWRIYQQMNGMEVVADPDFSTDPLFGVTLSGRKTIVTNKGEGIRMEIGDFCKDEMPLIRVVAVVDYGHWNFMPAAQVMWDYFKMFSRDPQTKKLIYHGK